MDEYSRVELIRRHLWDLRAEADERRRAGELPRSRRLRRYVGELLIAAGELLVRNPRAAACADC
ncbi:MAG TPA: hypothetical protein VKX16_07945 [Chloroflexota bacterium]|nr:hypothetical protein [Chloroflexota bacterium]